MPTTRPYDGNPMGAKRRIDLHVTPEVANLLDGLPPNVSRSAIFAAAVRREAGRLGLCGHKRVVCATCGARLPTAAHEVANH